MIDKMILLHYLFTSSFHGIFYMFDSKNSKVPIRWMYESSRQHQHGRLVGRSHRWLFSVVMFGFSIPNNAYKKTIMSTTWNYDITDPTTLVWYSPVVDVLCPFVPSSSPFGSLATPNKSFVPQPIRNPSPLNTSLDLHNLLSPLAEWPSR